MTADFMVVSVERCWLTLHCLPSVWTCDGSAHRISLFYRVAATQGCCAETPDFHFLCFFLFPPTSLFPRITHTSYPETLAQTIILQSSSFLILHSLRDFIRFNTWIHTWTTENWSDFISTFTIFLKNSNLAFEPITALRQH